jgi:hypothetical protein
VQTELITVDLNMLSVLEADPGFGYLNSDNNGFLKSAITGG